MPQAEIDALKPDNKNETIGAFEMKISEELRQALLRVPGEIADKVFAVKSDERVQAQELATILISRTMATSCELVSTTRLTE